MNSVSFNNSSRGRALKLSIGALCHGLTRRDVMPLDAGLTRPRQDSVACEFASIVANHGLLLVAIDHQAVEFPTRTDAGEREVLAISATRVCGRRRSQATKGRWAPNRHRRPGSDHPLSAAAAAHREFLFPLEAGRVSLG